MGFFGSEEVKDTATTKVVGSDELKKTLLKLRTKGWPIVAGLGEKMRDSSEGLGGVPWASTCRSKAKCQHMKSRNKLLALLMIADMTLLAG